MAEGNVLYYGDNLDVLRRHIKDETVGLVYLDPPFNSNADYNVLFKEHGEKAVAQVQAFEDTWEWNTESAAAYQAVVQGGGAVAEAMRSFRTMVGDSDMLAYLSMMAPRLIELRRALKPTGNLFLHCDPTASHYLKLLLDAVFGPGSFRNEIIWHYDYGARSKRTFGTKHDVIFWYSKSRTEWTFNASAVLVPYTSKMTEWRYTKGGQAGKPMPAGKIPSDVWDIKLNAMSKERLGYPTQKPLELMDRIIKAASNPNDLVLDPFCGCGTTIDAAQELGRRWIGIDITHLSIGLIKHRLAGRYGPEIATTYRSVGEPTSVDDARVLATEDPWQFQAWALGLVGARQAGSDKKGGDKGIDGKLYFHDSADTADKQIVFSVKAGRLNPGFLRDLRGVIEREEAQIGVLLSFEEPTAGMRAEAASAGFYASPWGTHPRVQLRTVGELLAGQGIDYPHVTGANVTHRRAQRARSADAEPMELFAAETPAPYGSDESDDSN